VNNAQIIRSILHQPTNGVIPRELLTTDRVMQRWAVGCGDGLPSDEWDDSRKSRPPALDDDTQVVIDRIVNKLPRRTNRVVIGWYLRPLPTSALARELNMSPRSLEKSLHVSLNFLKWKFEGTNHLTLMRLLVLRIS